MKYYYLIKEKRYCTGEFVAIRTYDDYRKAWRDWNKFPDKESMKLIQSGDDVMSPASVGMTEYVQPVKLIIRGKKLYAVRDGWRVRA